MQNSPGRNKIKMFFQILDIWRRNNVALLFKKKDFQNQKISYAKSKGQPKSDEKFL